MFEKITAIEPVSLIPEAVAQLSDYAKTVVMYDDIPRSEEEIIKRIGDSDGVLVSYTSNISKNILVNCPNIRYIGMCCSLYSEESANVDIAFARERGIKVSGIRDYGDRGVVEFVLCELIRFLHGYDRPMWKEEPVEITGLRCGVIGLGTSGAMIADALQFMGAEVSYFSRTQKPKYDKKGIRYVQLERLLETNDVIFTCLNKNVILLHQDQFEKMGNGKILFNTSIGPSFELAALMEWLNNGKNYFICDTEGAAGGDGQLLKASNVYCANASAGRTKQAFGLLSRKVMDNIRLYLNQE